MHKIIKSLLLIGGIFCTLLSNELFSHDNTLSRLIKTDQVPLVVEFLKNSTFKPDNSIVLETRSIEMLKILEKSGLDFSYADSNGTSLLLIAAQNNSSAIIEYLLHLNLNINYKDNYGRTALYYSCGNNSTDSLNLILSYNPYIDNQTSEGRTPLIFAVQEGNANAVKLLLNKGANPNIKDFSGKTARDYALETPDVDYVDTEQLKLIRQFLEK
jgi:ankyrin repeat protein